MCEHFEALAGWKKVLDPREQELGAYKMTDVGAGG